LERSSVLGRATLQVNPEMQLFAEAGYAYNEFKLTLPPTTLYRYSTFNQEPVLYPAGGPYYPTAFADEYGLTGDLDLAYRTVPLGNRVNDVRTNALRAVAGADGSWRGWDYGTALVYSRNWQTDDLASGYVSQQRLLSALLTGLINPFGASGPDGDALLRSTQVYGDYHTATGSTWLIDAKASRELARLPGGPLALALGGEVRREKLENSFSPLVQSGDVVTILQHDTAAGSRNAQAAYAEFSIPFAPGWETQVAFRYDHYSDFGGTTNPKVALRWQPAKSLLLRSSWGRGFRAPALYDLYTPLSQTFTSPYDKDPLRCPVTELPADCDGEFLAAIGGNPNLQPETSEQFNAGVVWEPLRGLAFTVDYWKINKSDTIGPLPSGLVLGDPARWAANIHRGARDPAFPGLPGPIEWLLLWNENLGSRKTSGVDAGISLRSAAASMGTFTFKLDGTYVSTYSVTLPGATDAQSGVGNNAIGAVPRWRHYASLDWSYGPWSATLAQLFQSGYDEIDPDTCDSGNCAMRRVGSYSQWDVQAQYTGFRSLTLVAGIRNLVGTDPPFMFNTASFAGVGDPTVADPRGRTFYARLTYAFK